MKNTYKFDFKTGEFVMKNGSPAVLSGLDALKMWIEKCLRTQLGRYSIYNGTGYGANIEDLVIGNTYGIDFAESELQREIETALLKHDNINSLTDFSVTRSGDLLTVSFTLDTVYGTDTEVLNL
ncbi:MAG: DUF2634 domain-containing protein [Oscillospiraceae bacterium]|nr:DUF2634 domain-containing protein [Oscillospiraceae bacterium]